MSRRNDLVLLLGSLHDHLPALGTALKPTTGMAANARKPCPDCGHTQTPGWLVDGFKRQRPCRSCGGVTEPKLKRGRGWVHYDPMDVLERPVQTTEAAAPPTRAPGRVGCDACGGFPNSAGTGVGRPHLDDDGREYRDPCVYCGGAGWRELTRFDLQLERLTEERSDRVTEAVDARTLAGSYHELDMALARLPGRWRAVVWNVHVAGVVSEEELDPLSQATLRAGMLVLEHLMPETIRVPGAVRACAKRKREHLKAIKGRRGLASAARDKEIRKLVRVGKPVQWVAAEYGLSVRQVYRLVKGYEEREAA